MVRYLNTQTREDVVVISGIEEILQHISKRWKDTMKNPPKRVIEHMKASARFAACAIKELDKELDDTEVVRLYRMATTTKFQLTYVKHDLSSKAPGSITYDITEDERDNLVEALAEVRCHNCNGRKKDCTVRDQFFKWDVTPIHEITSTTYPCQYMEG